MLIYAASNLRDLSGGYRFEGRWFLPQESERSGGAAIAYVLTSFPSNHRIYISHRICSYANEDLPGIREDTNPGDGGKTTRTTGNAGNDR